MKEHIHLIGIGGYGLSAIARVLHEMGYQVSGSDRQLSDLAINLKNQGVTIFEGHAADHIEGAQIVVRSSAIPSDNPEILAAKEKNIPVQKRDQFLGNLIHDFKGIGIAGTHGKTTTTAMIAWMLYALGKDPSYIIGGVSKNLGNNAHAGSGPYFVIEADEYDHMFLGLHLHTAILTNMEHDHPDCYPTQADYLQAFIQFVQNVPEDGLVLMNADDSGLVELQKFFPQNKYFTFGFHPTANYQARNLTIGKNGGYAFDFFTNQGEAFNTHVELSVPGKHNVLNACAALALADQLGLNMPEAAKAIDKFTSTGRRFDILGTVNQITIIDDYAHHPTEIKATLEGAKSRFPGQRIWAVWQPHTFSRTQTLFEQFCSAFTDADQVIVTEIFASREKNDRYSAQTVVEHMHHPDVRFIKTLQDVCTYLLENLQPGDVLLVLTAGDADQISKTIYHTLKSEEVV